MIFLRQFILCIVFLFVGAQGLVAQDVLDKESVVIVTGKVAERQAKRQARALKRLKRKLEDSLAYKNAYYKYVLLQDLDQRNYENLGWWQFKYNIIDSLANRNVSSLSPADSLKNVYAKQELVLLKVLLSKVYDLEANRLASYRDIPAVIFLLMLRTIVNPTNFMAYLALISYSSDQEDYGTALFYLEAALKNGFNDTDTLSKLPSTGLLRIMPEYQALLEVYLNKGSYGIREENMD